MINKFIICENKKMKYIYILDEEEKNYLLKYSYYLHLLYILKSTVNCNEI